MDILFQIHYEWNKELFCLYYQTQNRKYRRILLFFCGAVIIFSFCLCSKIGREMIFQFINPFIGFMDGHISNDYSYMLSLEYDKVAKI